MKRNYIILQTNTDGMGIVKIQTENAICSVTVDIKGYKPLSDSEIFKTYILADKIVCAGASESGREVFNIRSCGKVEAAAVTRKNKNSEVIEFWGGNEAICALLENCINPSPQTEKEPMHETEKNAENSISAENEKEAYSETEESIGGGNEAQENNDENMEFDYGYTEKKSESEENESTCELDTFEPESGELPEEYNPKCELPERFTFENYFGGGFAWQKINGYYCVKDYKIIQYLMAVDNVYEAINKFGYYYFGEKSDGSTEYFAFAVPADDSRIIPFNITPEFVYRVDGGGRMYYAVCVGRDESGEFFVGLEE